MKSGLEIAQEAELQPIADIARTAGLSPDELELFGTLPRQGRAARSSTGCTDRPDGKLVITTAITPTKAGEGKTTTSRLADAGPREDRQEGRCSACASPRWARCSAIKGGGNGGGYAQVVPMEEINLHFNGDFHAVTAAHNLLAAALDASIYNGNPLDIDPADDHVAADARHERPRAALHGRRPRRQGARHPARERVRHHGGVRDHGGVRAGERPAGPPRAARPHRRRRRPTTASP